MALPLVFFIEQNLLPKAWQRKAKAKYRSEHRQCSAVFTSGHSSGVLSLAPGYLWEWLHKLKGCLSASAIILLPTPETDRAGVRFCADYHQLGVLFGTSARSNLGMKRSPLLSGGWFCSLSSPTPVLLSWFRKTIRGHPACSKKHSVRLSGYPTRFLWLRWRDH